jgi:hypothetical protein
MNANELMLGNYVKDYNGFESYVVNIYDDEILTNFDGNQGDVFDYKPNELSGVQLTKDLIIKLGFIKVKNGYKKGDFYIGNDKGCYYSETYLHFDAVYVHQLQNIYFALTNSQLTIK